MEILQKSLQNTKEKVYEIQIFLRKFASAGSPIFFKHTVNGMFTSFRIEYNIK